MKKVSILFIVMFVFIVSTLNAQVVYVDITDGVPQGIDFNQDGTNEFDIDNFGMNVPGDYIMYWNYGADNNIHALGTVTTQDWDVPDCVANGFTIDATGQWEGQGDCAINGWGGSNTSITNNQDEYLAVRFNLGTDIYYGWVRFLIDGTGNITYKDYAYNTTPNTAIDAGDMGNTIVLVNSITVQGQAGATTIATQGGTLQMIETVLPANATDNSVAWSVTNGTGSATISAGGLLTATENGTVTVIVTANDASGVSGSLEITISNQAAGLANDNPCTATVLTVETTCNFSTFTNQGASSSSVPDPSCTVYQGNDVWFSFIVPPSGNVMIAADEGDIIDGCMAIYSGTCDALNIIGCNDDSSPYGATEEMPMINVTDETPGNTLWVRFWAYNNEETGTFKICAQEVVEVPNDEPCSSTTLTVEETCVFSTFTTLGSTPSNGVPNPGCAAYLGNDVWFSFTVPASGNVTVTSNEGDIQDGGMAVYSGTCDALNLEDCNDDDSVYGSEQTMPMVSLTDQTPGSTLWVRFWAFSNAEFGTFMISVFDSDYVGISELSENAFSIFPNPSSDFITIETNKEIEFERMMIYSLDGKTVFNSNLNNQNDNIDIRSLVPGLYSLVLIDKNGYAYNKKWLKK